MSAAMPGFFKHIKCTFISAPYDLPVPPAPTSSTSSSRAFMHARGAPRNATRLVNTSAMTYSVGVLRLYDHFRATTTRADQVVGVAGLVVHGDLPATAARSARHDLCTHVRLRHTINRTPAVSLPHR